MKKIALILALITALFSLCACGGAEKPAQKPTVSMFDLSRSLLEAHGEEPRLAYVSSSDNEPASLLANVTDIDYDKVEAFMILYAEDGSRSADEIVVIALKDRADAEACADSLRAHVETRRALYRTYEPKLAKELDSAEVFTQEQYAVLIVCAESGAVESAFRGFIR